MKERKKILWLVGWYPNKYDAFDGDFIQRHAAAAALYDNVHLIFIKQDSAQKTFEKTVRHKPGLTEEIIYLPALETPLGKLKNFRNWQAAYRNAVAEAISDFHPDGVHVHIPWKTGLIALWIKKKYGIPYLITEHWGIYNTEVDDNIYRRSFFVRYYLKRIFRQAKNFISVSQFLGKGVNKALVQKRFSVIPNVVDTSLFFPQKEKRERFTFLHVSNMVPLKNVEGILRAFQQFLVKSGSAAQLILIGNKDERYPAMAEGLSLLNSSVFFRGEVPYEEVAAAMRSAHVFVMNSHIENSPCVIGEALCCGLPVVATAVGGIPELLTSTPHILIPPKNDGALTNAMVSAFSSYLKANSQPIATTAHQHFSYSAVGKKMHSLYQ